VKVRNVSSVGSQIHLSPFSRELARVGAKPIQMHSESTKPKAHASYDNWIVIPPIPVLAADDMHDVEVRWKDTEGRPCVAVSILVSTAFEVVALRLAEERLPRRRWLPGPTASLRTGISPPPEHNYAPVCNNVGGMALRRCRYCQQSFQLSKYHPSTVMLHCSRLRPEECHRTWRPRRLPTRPIFARRSD